MSNSALSSPWRGGGAFTSSRLTVCQKLDEADLVQQVPRQEKEVKIVQEQDDELGERGIWESCAQDTVSVGRSLEKPA